jgi:hypothetical protein
MLLKRQNGLRLLLVLQKGIQTIQTHSYDEWFTYTSMRKCAMAVFLCTMLYDVPVRFGALLTVTR